MLEVKLVSDGCGRRGNLYEMFMEDGRQVEVELDNGILSLTFIDGDGISPEDIELIKKSIEHYVERPVELGSGLIVSTDPLKDMIVNIMTKGPFRI